LFIFIAYTIGGTANHNLFLAIHEITHNLAFQRVAPNKLLAIFANFPIGIPYAAAFKVGFSPGCAERKRKRPSFLGISHRTS
jgi:hypothetical protein